MIIDTELCFALKNSYGQYEMAEISIFHMEKLKITYPFIKIHEIKGKELKFSIKCPLCNEIHSYSYNINDIFKREVIIGGCESIGIPLFYMGSICNVRNRINKINNINNRIYAMI